MSIRRGQIVEVDFQDHAEGSKSMRFVVYGRIVSITRKAIAVECWGYRNKRAKRDANSQTYTIVRGAIHKITQLARMDSK